MAVSVDGVPRYRFAVSTGRAGYGTPSGTYRPQRLAASWFSKLYYNSPMPHSIFFHGGYAIHGSYEINRLGGPASHGCIRLHPANAATLFELVEAEGMGATTIVVSGRGPVLASKPSPSRQPYAEWRTPTYEDRYRPDYGQPYYWRPEPRASIHTEANRDVQHPHHTSEPMAGALWTGYDASFLAIWVEAMKRRSRPGGKPAKARPRGALKPKGRCAPKALSHHRGAAPAREAEVAGLTRELNEATSILFSASTRHTRACRAFRTSPRSPAQRHSLSLTFGRRIEWRAA
jgi:hypothetical protein